MYDQKKLFNLKVYTKVPEQSPYKHSLSFLYLILPSLFFKLLSAKVF